MHAQRDLAVNGVDLREDVEAALDAFHVQQWAAFGKHIGAALARLRSDPHECAASCGGHRLASLTHVSLISMCAPWWSRSQGLCGSNKKRHVGVPGTEYRRA